MSFEDLSTWHRLLVHRVADRYGLERVIGGTDGNVRCSVAAAVMRPWLSLQPLPWFLFLFLLSPSFLPLLPCLL